MLTGTVDEVAEQAERILKSVAPTACTNAQEWDNRIDCLIKLPDGNVIGEMVGLDKATEERIREAGLRLRQRFLGNPVPLQNELWAPIRILPTTVDFPEYETIRLLTGGGESERKRYMDDDARLELLEIINTLSADDRSLIAGLQAQEIIRLHHGLGTRIRNEFRGQKLPALWRWSRSQLSTGSPSSFDALSLPVLVEIWRNIKK